MVYLNENMLLLLETMTFLIGLPVLNELINVINERLRYSTETTVGHIWTCWINILLQTIVSCNTAFDILHCLLSKMVYLNVKYVIVTRNYEFSTYTCTQNLIGNITLSIVIIPVGCS